jgi:hypothetical protein
MERRQRRILASVFGTHLILNRYNGVLCQLWALLNAKYEYPCLHARAQMLSSIVSRSPATDRRCRSYLYSMPRQLLYMPACSRASMHGRTTNTGMWLVRTKKRGLRRSHIDFIVRPSSAYRLQSPIIDGTVVPAAHPTSRQSQKIYVHVRDDGDDG